MTEFSHLNAEGKAKMVDVSSKDITLRLAKATTKVILPQVVLDQFEGDDLTTKKGPVFQTAILAGIMGVKKTSDLIPLCHPLAISKCDVNIDFNDKKEVIIECTVGVNGKTGVEMEALTGASIAALTIYDMCKAFSHDIVISETRLIKKTGGKSDFERD